MRLRTWIVLLIVVAVAATAGVVWYRAASGVPVEAAIVERGTIHTFVDERAVTRIDNTHLVTMPFSGRIQQIDWHEGMAIRRGEVVAQIVPRDLELAVEQATAAWQQLEQRIAENANVAVENTALAQARQFVASMKATIGAAQKRVQSGVARDDYAKADLVRVQGLAESRTVPRDELDQAQLRKLESGFSLQ